jgi:hypothetical protein
MFCISVYYNDHALCYAFGLMYLPWIIYVKNDSYAYSELNCISFLKCMRLIMNENVLFRIVTPTRYPRCATVILGYLPSSVIVTLARWVKGVLQIGIRAKVSTLSLDGPVERSLDRECEDKLGLEGQFRTLVYSKMSRSYLTRFKSSGGIAAL